MLVVEQHNVVVVDVAVAADEKNALVKAVAVEDDEETRMDN